MNVERMEMDIKTIIKKHCQETKPLNLTPKSRHNFGFSPTRYSFDEKQFDTISLQLIDYINQNHGGGKKVKTN